MAFLKELFEPKIRFTHRFEMDITELREHAAQSSNKIFGPIFITSHRNIWYRWRVHIFPDGGSFLSYLDGAKGEVRAGFQISVVKENGSTGKSISFATTTFSKDDSKGSRQFLRRAYFGGDRGFYSAVNSRKKIEINILLRIGVSQFNPLKILPIESEVPDRDKSWFFRSWIRFSSSTLSESEEDEKCYFGPLFKELDAPEKSKFSDFEVIADDYAIFHCHKFVFLNKIPDFFQGLMNFADSNQESGTLDLSRYRKHVVHEILHFLYCNKVSEDFTPEIVDEVLDLAEMLNIPDLKAECGIRMEALLNMENVEEVAAKAERYKMDSLSVACVKMMVRKLRKSSAISLLLRSDGFDIPVARNMGLSFVAENMAFFRESGEFHNLPENMKTEIMNLLEQGMLVSKVC